MLIKIHVITYKTEYLRNLISSIFLQAEFGEMKIGISIVEITNTGLGIQLYWHHLLVMMFKKTVFFTSKRVFKTHSMTELCSHDPTFTLHFAGWYFGIIKSNILNGCNIFRGKGTKVRIVELLNTIPSLLGRNIVFLDNLSDNTKFVNCNQRQAVPQYKQFSNVFYKKNKV